MKEKKILINALTNYYKSIDRHDPPKYETYTLQELRKCIIIFKIKI